MDPLSAAIDGPDAIQRRVHTIDKLNVRHYYGRGGAWSFVEIVLDDGQ